MLKTLCQLSPNVLFYTPPLQQQNQKPQQQPPLMI
jgi:hypothetical protein